MPVILTRNVEIKRTRSGNAGYLAILIRQPLTRDEIAAVADFLSEIDPEARWYYKGDMRDADSA